MHPLVRPIVVFTASCVMSVSVLFALGESQPLGLAPMEAAASGNDPFRYRFSRLKLLRDTLFHVRESYVEPDRLDLWNMFDGALRGVERRVPTVMFEREGRRLLADIGEERSLMELPELTDLGDLEAQLREVAVLLEAGLRADDVPEDLEEVGTFAALEFAMTNGILHSLDPHSVLLPPEASKEMEVENKGEFGGLGVTVRLEDGYLRVEHPLPASPADRGGLKSGDEIRRINGESTLNMTLDDAVRLLRGRVGTQVSLEVAREGFEELLAFTLQRERIKLNPVSSALLDDDVGYIRIRTFHSTVGDDVRRELVKLREGAGRLQGVVLDLRDNPGGYLTQAIEVADTFLSDGEIVSTRSPHQRRPETKDATRGPGEEDFPLAVLVNANSASASEIVAGALRNNDRAVIVGERTFGKGSVQNLHNMAYGAKLKITIAHYFTPGERSIQSVGIPADIEMVPAFFRPEGDDPAKALMFAREQVRRESNLEDHLEREDAQAEASVFSFRYLEDWEEGVSPRHEPELGKDPYLDVAVELLSQSGRSRTRTELLNTAESMVATAESAQARSIRSAFRAFGVNWAPGPIWSGDGLKVDIRTSGGDQVLRAGRKESVEVVVTNTSDKPMYQVAAVVEESELLKGEEFFFGHIPAGGSRSYRTEVQVEHGYPAERSPVELSLRQLGDQEIRTVRTWVDVEPMALPELAWRWEIVAPEDGSIDMGDEVEVRLHVDNVGQGPTSRAVARVRNASGKALDIITGTLPIGEARTETGEPCDPREDESCLVVLDPGKSFEGTFKVQVRERLDFGYQLELNLEDGGAYDYGAIVRTGLREYHGQSEDIRFKLGTELVASERHMAPVIEISNAPGPVLRSPVVTLSGRVNDEDGVRHVVIYVDEEKVFHQGSHRAGSTPSVPFIAELDLEPGLHTVTVVAKDDEGFVSSTSRVLNVEDLVSDATHGDGLR